MLTGFRAALGAPAIAMAATFVGFGAGVSAAGLPLYWALGASLLIYGMPGQLILLNAVAGGAPVWGAVPSAIVANARFLPMTVALAPWLGQGPGRWLAPPLISVTTWAAAMLRLPLLPPTQRLGWFLAFASTCLGLGAASTMLGFWLAPFLPGWLLVLLLFTNPLYFALLLAAASRAPPARRAVLAGLLASPLALWLPASWGLLVAGLLGGSLAFWWGTRASR